MYLINVRTKQLEPFLDGGAPPYAILSHTWGTDDEEISFQDVREGLSSKSGTGRSKFDGCCVQAQKDNLGYVWIDTCCIDKSSAVELSEAINSMFRWYKDSAICYVYLSDVTVGDDATESQVPFQQSRWFTRGWTLQELIAPKTLHFYNAQWTALGTKQKLATELFAITGIPRLFLLGTAGLHEASVAQRMSWAAKRATKRREDMAYCLLGIFDISMTMIYGEGDRAFLRLQEEIMRHIPDDTLLAWEHRISTTSSNGTPCGALATSPSAFLSNGHIVPDRQGNSFFSHAIQISGGSLQLQRCVHTDLAGQSFVILNCHPANETSQVIGVPVQLDTTHGPDNLYKRLPDSPTVPLAKVSVRGERKSIWLHMGGAQGRTSSAGQCSVYVENSQQQGLKLIEVEPQRCWNREWDEITTSSAGDSSSQRVWTRFRSSQYGSLDIIVALDFRWLDSQPEVDYRVVASSKAFALSDVARDFDKLGISTLEKHDASNGITNVHVHIVPEPQGWRKIFGLRLDINNEIHDTVNVSSELIQLDLYRELASKFLRSHELCLEAKGLEQRVQAEFDKLQSNDLRPVGNLRIGTLENESPPAPVISQAFPRRVDYLQQKLDAIRFEQRELQESSANIQAMLESLHKEQSLEARNAGDWPARLVHHLSEMILPFGAEDIDSLQSTAQQLIVVAARIGNQMGFDYLFGLGLDHEMTYKGLSTLVENAIIGGGMSIVDKLLTKVDLDIDSTLIKAALNGYDAGVRLLLDKGANIESTSKKGRSALAIAARNGNETVIRLLLDKGANVESRDGKGYSPLANAAWNGHEAAIRLLLDKGANIEAKDNNGYSPLAVAARKGHEAAIILLLDKGANIEAKDNNGYSPLANAAWDGREAAIRLLLDKEADIESKDNEGDSPLANAIWNNQEATIRLLLDKGADTESENKKGRTPLAIAASKGFKAAVRLLLDSGADIETEDKRGKSPLDHASQNDQKSTKKILEAEMSHLRGSSRRR